LLKSGQGSRKGLLPFPEASFIHILRITWVFHPIFFDFQSSKTKTFLACLPFFINLQGVIILTAITRQL
jgi:hypothetical protein